MEIVGAADDQLVFLRQRFGDVHAERGIAALVAAQVLPVHEHLCNLIGSADVEQHPLPAEALRQKKAAAIPQWHAFLKMPSDAGKPGLRAEGHGNAHIKCFRFPG